MHLDQALERLVDTIEQRGHVMRSRLRPGLSREMILRQLAPLGITPPEDLISLYMWHNGMIDLYDRGAWLFGEYRFLPLETAIEEYLAIQEYFPEPDLVQRAQLLPFASFQAQYCAIYCGGAVGGLPTPIVEIYDAYTIVFEDPTHAALTAAAWYEEYQDGPRDPRLREAIRRRLNPRIPALDL